MPDPVVEIFDQSISLRQSKAQARATRRAEKSRRKATGIAGALLPKNANQRRYFEYLGTGNSVFVVGPAGTGKTHCAARFAARKLLNQEIVKIIVARVTVGDQRHALGFLPGKLDQKLKPWLVPVFDGLRAEVGNAVLDQWQQEGRLEIASFEHMRGRTFSDAFVLLDEAQNASRADLRLLLTRIGENTQIIVTGDLEQIDDIKNSGLGEVIDLAKRYNAPIQVVEFGEDDVVRSEFTKAWVKIFAAEQRNLDALPDFLHNTPKNVR